MNETVDIAEPKVRVITNPTVILVGYSQLNEDSLNEFLGSEGIEWSSDGVSDIEKITEVAGRICYMSFTNPRPGGNAAYLQHIRESGHGSVFEHGVYNFVITGISRSLTHELVRHRAGAAYSQLSQRYVDESVAEYVVPPDMLLEYHYAAECLRWVEAKEAELRSSGEKFDRKELIELFLSYNPKFDREPVEAGLLWLSTIKATHKAYVELSGYMTKKAKRLSITGTDGRKYARQAARSVLPNATETKLMVSLNGRAVRHVIEMRGSRFADPEIKSMAIEMLYCLKAHSPNLFADYDAKVEPSTNQLEVDTKFRKV